MHVENKFLQKYVYNTKIPTTPTPIQGGFCEGERAIEVTTDKCFIILNSETFKGKNEGY